MSLQCLDMDRTLDLVVHDAAGGFVHLPRIAASCTPYEILWNVIGKVDAGIDADNDGMAARYMLFYCLPAFMNGASGGKNMIYSAYFHKLVVFNCC